MSPRRRPFSPQPGSTPATSCGWRPVPAAASFLIPSASPRSTRCGGVRRCAARGCAARCFTGMASWRTTRAWSPAWPGSASRFIFALPQSDGTIFVGLTDEPVEGDVPDVPEPTDAEIDFLLNVMSVSLERPLRRGNVVGAFAGLRPLLDAEGHTTDLS